MTALEPVTALHAVLLVVGGFCAGVLNVVAGAGSALTLPVLMLSGLDLHAANATNRIAVAVQVVVGTTGFHRAGVRPWRAALGVLPASLLGGLVGAVAVSAMPTTVLHTSFGLLFIGLAVLMLRRPAWLVPTPESTVGEHSPWRPRTQAWFFAVGVYGGMFQAGVGIPLLLVAVRCLGLDTLAGNAAKIALTGAFTLMALLVFGASGQLDLPRGLLLAAGTTLGAMLGVRVAQRIDTAILRWVIIGALLVAAVRAFWVVTQGP
jgi:uncharacterized membrane protein YfcA